MAPNDDRAASTPLTVDKDMYNENTHHLLNYHIDLVNIGRCKNTLTELLAYPDRDRLF